MNLKRKLRSDFMGRIKTILVKRVTKQLVNDHKDEFSEDYAKNKEVVRKYTDIKSPKVTFHNLKQRMQELVADRGSVDCIEFDIKRRRYLFNNYDVLEKKEVIPKDENKFPTDGNSKAFDMEEANEIIKKEEGAPF